MYGSIVVVLNIGKTLILGLRALEIVHAQDVHDHLVDGLGLAIHSGVEVNELGEIGVQQ
jgi:hypothetical protein